MNSSLEYRLRNDSLEPMLYENNLNKSSSQSLSLPSSEDRVDSKRCSISSNSIGFVGKFFQKFTDLLRSLSQRSRELLAPLIILFSSRAFKEAVDKLDLPDN